MAEPFTYHHPDIQRYLQHKMSPQEMHEFEKALMNDPFLADAIEGFSAGDQVLAEIHLSSIETALNDKHEKARVVPIASQKATWWRVAAIVLVVIFAGALTYSVVNNRSSKESSMAVATSETPAIIKQNDTISAADQPLASVQALPEKKIFEDHRAPVIRSEQQPSIADQPPPVKDEEQEDMAMTYEMEERAALTAASARMSKAKTNEAASATMLRQQSQAAQQAQNEFKGKVADETGEPIPFASIRVDNGNTSTVSDAKGNFSLKAADSVVKVSVQSSGYAAATAEILSDKPANITLGTQQQSLSEVVIIGMATKKKRGVTAAQADSSLAAEPAGGWKRFQQYLNHSVDSLKTTEDLEEVIEDIVLEFSIDNHGRPTDIKALKEANKIKSEKAIEILGKGPKWSTKKKDKKVKVIIAL